MNKQPQNENQPKSLLNKVDEGMDTGTTNLAIAGGIGVYGGSIFATSGIICPACIIAAPLFLGIGAMQRRKFLKKQAEKETKEEKSDTTPQNV